MRPSAASVCGAPNCIGVIGSKKNVVKSKGYQSGDDDDEPARPSRRAKRRAGEMRSPSSQKKIRGSLSGRSEDVMALEEAVESARTF